METGVVITQEPVFTKTSVEEAHAEVVLDHSTMDVDKVNLSTVLDNSTIQGEPEVAEVVNVSGETEESKHEKEQVMTTISVEGDNTIVKEKASETETDEKGTDDGKIVSTDMTIEKEREDETTQKAEKVNEKPETEEGQTETKHSQAEEKDISKASEDIPIKTDEVKEEKDSTTVKSSVNGTEIEHNETVSVEEISNIAKETAPEQETTTHEVETTERKDPEIVNNGETTVQESISTKEDAETVEAIKNSDDAEQVSREVVTEDKEKEEDIIHKKEEVQKGPTVIEAPTVHGEASKATEEHEHEHVLVRDIPQEETLVPKDETVNTSTVQESAILKTLETKSDETDAEPSLDLKEEEETVTPSDEGHETVKVVIEPPKPSTDQRSKDTEEDEHVLGSNMPHGEIFVTEAESLVTKEDKEKEDKEQEKRDMFEVPIDLALKAELMVEKKEEDQVSGVHSVERVLALNEPEAEETPVRKHSDVESGEQMEKSSLESPELSEETIKTEEVAPHREGQEEGSYGSETKEDTVAVPESIDLAPLQEESCLPNEQDDEVKSDEVIQVSSESPKGETLVEAKKIEVIKSNEEDEQVADNIQSILETVDTEPVKSNEKITVHESISLKDDSDTVEESKNPDDAEQVSHEVTGDREKEEDIIIHKALEVQESLAAVETPTIQGEDTQLKASKNTTEEHEHVLVTDIPQEETLVPKAETVNTSTVHESAEPSLGLKEKEETVQTVTSSDEVKESITLMEPPKLSPEQIPKDTEEDEQVLRSSKLQGDTIITEAESLVTKENKEQEDKKQEKTEGLQEVPTDLALKVDKEEVTDEKKEADEFAGGQNMERGRELNVSEADLVEQNITDDKQSIESPSEETSKTLDEKIQEKPEEKVPPHQEGQEEGSYGSETKEETVPVPESSKLKEKSQEERLLVITPFQEESFLPMKQDEEEIKEQIHEHEPANEEIKSDEVIQASSASPEGETLVEAKNNEETKDNEEEQVADKIQSILETVGTEPVKSNEDDITESLNSAGEEIQIKSKDGENVQLDETGEEKASSTPETSVNGREDEHNAIEEGISKNNEIIVHETNTEEIKNSEENSHEVTGDREKEEVQESPTVIETEVLQEDNIELKDSKDTMEYEHVLVRDMRQIDTLVTKVEDVNTSTVHKFEATTSKTLETTSDETEVGQETQKDIELSLELKEDKEKEETETVISSDEVRPSDQVDDVQTEESVEVKTMETLQVESTEETHENLLDVPFGVSEKLQPETVLVAKTESQDKTEEIPSDLVLKEEVKDEVDGTQVMGEQRDLEPNEPEAEQVDQTKTDEKLLGESVEKMQTSSLECPSEVSEENITTVGEKMEEKLQEEVTLQQKEETLSVQEIKNHGEEVSCLQQEPIEKYEPTNDQQSSVEEKSDEGIQISSEEHEGGFIVNAVKLEDIKENEEEQVVEEIVSETTEDEKVKKEEPIDQILSEEDAIKSHVTEDDNESLTSERKKGDVETTVRAKPQGETNVNEDETVDTSTVQEAAVSNTLETNINEAEAVHSPIGGEEEERQVTKEDTEPSLDLKGDKEHAEREMVDEVIKDESQGREESAEIKYKDRDTKLVDEPADEMQRPSLESPSEETSKTIDEKIEEEEVTLHQESEETVTVPESSELGVQAKEEEKEEESDQASAAPLSEEREAEDFKENEKEPVEASRPNGTESSKLVEEDKEILEVEEEVPSSETIPQETLSDDVRAIQLKREVNATTTESPEEEATVVQTRDVETSLTDKFSIEKVNSAEDGGETQTREVEENNIVDSNEKNDNETTLIAETRKEDEDKTEDASKTSENDCTKQQEFETPKVENKSQEVSETPAFISELEDKIPKQIEKIHEEEAQVVADQTSSLVEEIHEEEEETNEPHKVEALSGQNLPVEASHAHQPTEIVDKTANQVEEIHEEEEETNTVKLQQEEETLPTESVSSESFSERHVSAVTEESVGETKPKESGDQIESSTKFTKEEDEKEKDTQVAEIMKGQSLSHVPEDAGLEQKEELKGLGTLQHGAAMEDQDSVMNENSPSDFTFSNPIGEAEHGDENSSTLPVVGILKELQTTMEEKERGINNSEGGSSGNGLKSINAEPEALEKTLVGEETPASEIIEANMLQDSISRELEVVDDVEEQLQEETSADLSTQVLPGLIPSKQEEVRKQDDINASTLEKISLQEEKHPRDFEISKKERNAEAQETLKEEDQAFDIEEEKKNEVLQDEKLSTLSPEVNNNNQEDASELGVGLVEKDQEAHSVFGNAEEVNEVLTSENKITEPLSIVVEKELTEEHDKSQAASEDTKSSNEMDFTSEKIPKDQREEAEETVDASEKVQLQDQSKDFGQEKQSTDLKYVQGDLDDEMKDDGHDSVLAHKKDSDLIKEKELDYVKAEPEDAIKYGVSTEEKNMCEKIGQEATKEIYKEEFKQTHTATAVKEEIKEEEKETTDDNLNSMKNTDDGIKDYVLDSVVAQKKESGSIEEKKEADYMKTELEDAIKHGLPTEVNSNLSGKFGQEATKEIYQEECKQANAVTAIKEEIKEEKKETPEDFLNSMKNTYDATEKTKPEIQEIDKLSPVSETQENPPKEGDEVPTQQKREIADDVPKLENLKIAEEVQQKDGEYETEPIGKEPARKSLSDLIQNVKVTDKTEVATTEPRIEEEAKAKGDDEDGDEHKDDKTSPDSIVMVEAKDTVSIIKTQKKSHGILSGVGSKVKHSISKVKKALTGKSSHTTKPSSPQ
ncbi:unnamed protein product [Eruca vesicaria subsp. sativa]|uniref:Titin-like n=1 Tax=Eruca vesicaria subsp. sativa TaxID=29727 RepID=A0ABC8LAX9_ERUVS|nr:unnamed protein product [Eruca vesicaria subsp. sativa]